MSGTELPATLDATTLDPKTSTPSNITGKWTDTTTLLIRCEIWKPSRRLQPVTFTNYALPLDVEENLELLQQ